LGNDQPTPWLDGVGGRAKASEMKNVEQGQVRDIIGNSANVRDGSTIHLAPAVVAGYEAELKSGLEKLASGEMKGPEVAYFHTRAQTMFDGIDQGKSFRTVADSSSNFRPLQWVADRLSYAVGVMEGNFPPNDIGFTPEAAMSLSTKDSHIREWVDMAAEVAGDFPPALKAVFNKIVDRLERQLPDLGGPRIPLRRL
jgi:hypothetical protein